MNFYSNFKHLIDTNYKSIYQFIKQNKDFNFKQNTMQDYYNRTNNSALPKLEKVIDLSLCFNISIDDLIFKDLSKENAKSGDTTEN